MKHSQLPKIFGVISLVLFLFGIVMLLNIGNVRQDLFGFAIGQVTDVTKVSPVASKFWINPGSQTLLINTGNKDALGNPIIDDVETIVSAYPTSTSRVLEKFMYFEVTIRYEQDKFMPLVIKLKPAGWTIQSSQSYKVQGSLTMYDVTIKCKTDNAANAITPNNAIDLMSIEFRAKNPVEIKYDVITLTSVKLYLTPTSPTPYPLAGAGASGQMSLIKYKFQTAAHYYLDKDGDGYGDPATEITQDLETLCPGYAICVYCKQNPLSKNCLGIDQSKPCACNYVDNDKDCDDDKTNDPPNCPATASDCISTMGIMTMFASCAVCQSPGIPEVCDDVDNNCDGLLDGGSEFGDKCPMYCTLNGQETCTDGVDNDGDGYADKSDSDCVGKQGLCSGEKIIVWSYLPDESPSNPPANIGCCNKGECIKEVISMQNNNPITSKMCVGFEMFPLGDTANICGRHGDWRTCNAQTESQASDGGTRICKNGKWMLLADVFKQEECKNTGDAIQECKAPAFVIPEYLTPACGFDGDNDGSKCDLFEHFLNCPKDCKKDMICKCSGNGLIRKNDECVLLGDVDSDNKVDISDIECLNAVINGEFVCVGGNALIGDLNCDGKADTTDKAILAGILQGQKIFTDKNNDGVPDACEGTIVDCTTDKDTDGLPDEYEIMLNSKAGAKGLSTKEKSWFDEKKADTDGDGVNDNNDACPGTVISKGNLKFSTKGGHIDMNGCLVGDIGRETTSSKGADGCLSVFDTTSLILYYSSTGKQTDYCIDLYGNTVK